MKTTKKVFLFVFAIAVVINLQLSTPITTGMDNGFTIEQLVDNIFVSEAYASIQMGAIYDCWPQCGSTCWFGINPPYGCNPNDPDWDCWGWCP